MKVTTGGATISLEEAVTRGLVELIRNGERTIVVTDNHNPAVLDLTGNGVTLKVRELKSAGKGLTSGSGPASFYGPLSGAITIEPTGRVERSGKPVKPVHAGRAPRATAHVTRRGHVYLVRLTAKGKAGVKGIYYRIAGGTLTRYHGTLKLTRKQLQKLRFSSVDRFGDWESPQRARIPH